MPDLNVAQLETYLQCVTGSPARIIRAKVLGETAHEGINEGIKGCGYGTPVLLEYEADGKQQRAVLHTISPGPFGHEHMSDRAQILLWQHHSFNRLPHHVRSLDVGAFRSDRSALSLGEAEEFFILTEYAEGRGYFEDLLRMRDNPQLLELDLARADRLCDHLVEIHGISGHDPNLYTRRIRELVGHSECIMGLIDTYPPQTEIIDWKSLQEIERRCIEWRWRLKNRVHRLRQVHGDFHPWNILFRDDTDFSLLDRSRGEWGEPADDVACLTMNYLFFSLQRSGRLDGNLESLFRRFWDRYLTKTGDVEMLQIAAPFFAFRGLVMAHPIWYPELPAHVRQKLFNFIHTVLGMETFDPDEVNQYCES